MSAAPQEISLQQIREHMYSAVICDALDSVGLKNQSPRIQLQQWGADRMIVGRCRTTLWADMFHVDPKPYDLELQAVDSCKPDDVLIAATGSSMR